MNNRETQEAQFVNQVFLITTDISLYSLKAGYNVFIEKKEITFFCLFPTANIYIYKCYCLSSLHNCLWYICNKD